MAPAAGASADLDEELLALVEDGVSATPAPAAFSSSAQAARDQKHPVRKRSRGQDDDRDDSDDEYNNDDDGGRGRRGAASSRRNNRSQPSKRGRGGRGRSSESDEDDYNEDDDDDDEEEDDDDDDEEEIDDELAGPEWAEVRSWDEHFMGDAEDRKRLEAMSELDRELILEERQKKVDALQERLILRKRLSRQTGAKQVKGDRDGRKLSDREKKGKSLETLRRKRENRGGDGRSRKYTDDDDDDEDEDGDRNDRRGRQSAQDDKNEDKNKPKGTVNLEHILKAQITRDDLGRWVYANFFTKTIIGCFVRIGVGLDPTTREDVYRIARVVELRPSRKPYKIGSTLINSDMVLAHGKATRPFRMDFVSNKPFTDPEWRRYERTMVSEKQSLPSIDHVQRKHKDIEEARNHIFTNDEITEMIKRKSELIDKPQNIQLALVKAKAERANLVGQKNDDQIEALDRRIQELEEMTRDQAADGSSALSQLDVYAKLNERARKSNFNEGREAEKMLMEQKKLKGAADYDPFARRKTAPKHVIQTRAEDDEVNKKLEEESKLALTSKTDSPSTPRPPLRLARRTFLSLPKPTVALRSPRSSPSRAPIPATTIDDTFLDSIDVSVLEAELGIS